MGLRIAEIVPEAHRLSDREFVYLLTYKGEVVYVGRTMSLANRMLDHQASKKYDDVYFINAERTLSRKLESALVSLLQPKYNRTLGSPLTAHSLLILYDHGVDIAPAKDHPRLAPRLQRAIDIVTGKLEWDTRMHPSHMWRYIPHEVRKAFELH